jgi:hypothetical protein
MYDEEKTNGRMRSAVDVICEMVKKRLDECLRESDALEKQSEIMGLHRRALSQEISTLNRIMEAAQSEREKGVDVSVTTGSSANYASPSWSG